MGETPPRQRCMKRAIGWMEFVLLLPGSRFRGPGDSARYPLQARASSVLPGSSLPTNMNSSNISFWQEAAVRSFAFAIWAWASVAAGETVAASPSDGSGMDMITSVLEPNRRSTCV